MLKGAFILILNGKCILLLNHTVLYGPFWYSLVSRIDSVLKEEEGSSKPRIISDMDASLHKNATPKTSSFK